MKKFLIFLFAFLFFACSKNNENKTQNSISLCEKSNLKTPEAVNFIKNSFKVITYKAQEETLGDFISEGFDFKNQEGIKKLKTDIANKLKELNQGQYKNLTGGTWSTNAFPAAFHALQTLNLLNDLTLSKEEITKAKEMYSHILAILFDYSNENLSKATNLFKEYFDHKDDQGKKNKSNRTELLNILHNLFKKIEAFVKNKVTHVIKEENKIKDFLILHTAPYKNIFDALGKILKKDNLNLVLDDYLKSSKEGSGEKILKSNQEIFEIITDKKIEQLHCMIDQIASQN